MAKWSVWFRIGIKILSFCWALFSWKQLYMVMKYYTPADSANIIIMNEIKIVDKPLMFMHIPKTAGSSIENIGIKYDIYWGSELFRHVNINELELRE
eukprot:886133_1